MSQPAAPYDRPRPRPPKPAAVQSSIHVRNRRREHLRRNPDYFDSVEHEFADPVLYHSLVGRFQTPAEREADGLRKGYSRILEGDLLRGEAKLQELASAPKDGKAVSNGHGHAPENASLPKHDYSADDDDVDAERGRRRWAEFLRERFVQGDDHDFDYTAVDNDEDLDALRRQDEEDAWFDDEEPVLARQDQDGDDAMGQGDTGIQDF